METLQAITTNGDRTHLDEAAVQSFAERLRGELIRPGEAGYDEARSVWNAMIDKRPALIARCTSAGDVIAAVNFARENDLLIAVRGCGHNIAGKAVCDGGLMIDLSPMNAVRVDPDAQTARVEPGASLADMDAATQEHGLATPLGINSTTGVAGLTLGGGFGWLSRAYGMTVDNLLSVEIVTADGALRTASAEENPELFWAIRGGSGNFGVVTAFEFRLHLVGPEVLFGPIVYAGRDAPDVLRNLRDFNAQAPDEFAGWAVLRKAPPLPFLDEHVVGTDVLIVVPFYAGDMDEGERVFAPLVEFGSPVGSGVGPHPYAALQQAFDPLLTPGVRNYWKSHNFRALPDEAIDTAIEYAANVPTPLSEIFFGHVGGAMSRVPADATAYPHRKVDYVMNVHTRWEDPAQDTDCIAWAREFFEVMAPHAAGGSYVNFISEAEGKEGAAYGDNYDRLAQIKATYDPANLFRVNQNIEPAA